MLYFIQLQTSKFDLIFPWLPTLRLSNLINSEKLGQFTKPTTSKFSLNFPRLWSDILEISSLKTAISFFLSLIYLLPSKLANS